jgi:Ni/Co efflux regulator RcnB
MKKLIVTVAAIALMAPALAAAQPRDGQANPHGWGRFQYAPGSAPSAAPAAPAAQAPQRDFGNRGSARSGGRDLGNRGGDRGDRGSRRGRGAQSGAQSNAQAQNGGRFDRGDRNDRGRNWNGGDRRDRNGRADNRRFDDNRNWNGGRSYAGRNYAGRSFGSYSRNHGRFRVSPYRWPGGYRAAISWRVHQFLPSTFLLREYYIDNFYDYGFDAPPPGYEWIRVGEDALLVDVYTGEIVDVAPGVFYW